MYCLLGIVMSSKHALINWMCCGRMLDLPE